MKELLVLRSRHALPILPTLLSMKPPRLPLSLHPTTASAARKCLHVRLPLQLQQPLEESPEPTPLGNEAVRASMVGRRTRSDPTLVPASLAISCNSTGATGAGTSTTSSGEGAGMAPSLLASSTSIIPATSLVSAGEVWEPVPSPSLVSTVVLGPIAGQGLEEEVKGSAGMPSGSPTSVSTANAGPLFPARSLPVCAPPVFAEMPERVMLGLTAMDTPLEDDIQ